MVKTRWYDDTIIKTRWCDGENAMVRWHDNQNTMVRWRKHDGTMVKTRCIAPSRRVFHHRTNVFSPSYHHATPSSGHAQQKHIFLSIYYGVPFWQSWFFYFVVTFVAWWYDVENAMVRWHDDENTKVRWWKHDGTMMKSWCRDGTINKEIKSHDCPNGTPYFAVTIYFNLPVY